MALNVWTVIGIVIAVVVIMLLLFRVSWVFARRIRSGRYWVAIWVPMGWLASLALVEYFVNPPAGYPQLHFTYWQEYQLLWIFGFGMMMLGFLPQLRPRKRIDGLNLLIFSLSWTGFMLFLNLFWVDFVLFMSSISPS
jgi:hypothetical protein